MTPINLTTASFGATVLSLREQRGLTRDALASATQIHPTIIALIEQGMIGVQLPTIVSLADALGLSGGELLSTAERAHDAS